jgi:RNA polymerase sigma factor (sigma-70 family)
MNYSAEEVQIGIREQDAAIFRYLYRKYGKMISGHVLKNSGSEEDAREMIQIVMLEFWNAICEERYQEQGKMDQYIYQLAANNWRYELRRRRNRPQSTIDQSLLLSITDESDEYIAAAVVKDQYLNAIHQALDQLEGTCREIIQLYHLKEVNLQEVAERLKYDYNNLRKRIFDCRKKLKNLTEKLLNHAT